MNHIKNCIYLIKVTYILQKYNYLRLNFVLHVYNIELYL